LFAVWDVTLLFGTMFREGGPPLLPLLLLLCLPIASTFLPPSLLLSAPSAGLHLRSKSLPNWGRGSSAGGVCAVRSQFGGLFSGGGGGGSGGVGQMVDPATFSFSKGGGREPVASWASEAGRDGGNVKVRGQEGLAYLWLI
jgi:hypothetical protein